ncbi:armadillo-type protein [Mycena rosella]|uniref:Armadillo-type protein n=1 Tax=Mycena rosella TaxID=1033263 RepID=A0AAD7DGW1_MYCRO|nr:armadillo-type protein [Mycena rosella]
MSDEKHINCYGPNAWVFRILGNLRHLSGTLTAPDGVPPSYVQLYMYDPSVALQQRMKQDTIHALQAYDILEEMGGNDVEVTENGPQINVLDAGNAGASRVHSAGGLSVDAEPQLIALLHDADAAVIECAANVLLCTGAFPDEKRGVVNTKMLQCLPTLLKFPDAEAAKSRRLPSWSHINPCTQLVSLLHDTNTEVVECMVEALCEIALSSGGAQAVADTKLLDYVSDLLGSPINRIRRWTCELLAALAHQELTVASVLHASLCQKLASLLNARDDDLDVVWLAVYVLSGLAQLADGAQAIVDAQILDLLPGLLESPKANVRIRISTMLGGLASHESTAAVVDAKPCLRVVSLLRQVVILLN